MSEAAAEYWSAVAAQQKELVREYITNRRQKIAAGENDPYLHPLDGSGLFLKSIANRGARTVGGGVTVASFEVAARKIVDCTHVVCDTASVQAFHEECAARMVLARKSDEVIAGRRTVRVTLEPPVPSARITK
jgi:hypothetical protein